MNLVGVAAEREVARGRGTLYQLSVVFINTTLDIPVFIVTKKIYQAHDLNNRNKM